MPYAQTLPKSGFAVTSLAPSRTTFPSAPLAGDADASVIVVPINKVPRATDNQVCGFASSPRLESQRAVVRKGPRSRREVAPTGVESSHGWLSTPSRADYQYVSEAQLAGTYPVVPETLVRYQTVPPPHSV